MTLIWMAMIALVPAGLMLAALPQPQTQKIAVRARR